jgi:hypothetical protein
MPQRIKQTVSAVLLLALVASQSGCALVMLPALGGGVASGYLWGKDATRKEAQREQVHDTPAPQSQPAPEAR